MAIAALRKEQVRDVFQCDMASVMGEACSKLGLAGRCRLRRQLRFVVVVARSDLQRSLTLHPGSAKKVREPSCLVLGARRIEEMGVVYGYCGDRGWQ